MNLPWTLVNLGNHHPRPSDWTHRPWAIEDSTGAIIGRFDHKIDAVIVDMTAGFEAVNGRLDRHDARFDSIDRKLDTIIDRL